jgi:hypothetical protein
MKVDWLLKPSKTIFSGVFCRIMCRAFLAHLFGLGRITRKASKLPHIMALAEIKGLAERRHFLPDKMTAWRKDQAQKVFSTIPLALVGVAPLYAADAIRLLPLGSVALILANRAITLTNDNDTGALCGRDFH